MRSHTHFGAHARTAPPRLHQVLEPSLCPPCLQVGQPRSLVCRRAALSRPLVHRCHDVTWPSPHLTRRPLGMRGAEQKQARRARALHECPHRVSGRDSGCGRGGGRSGRAIGLPAKALPLRRARPPLQPTAPPRAPARPWRGARQARRPPLPHPWHPQQAVRPPLLRRRLRQYGAACRCECVSVRVRGATVKRGVPSRRRLAGSQADVDAGPMDGRMGGWMGEWVDGW
eukprot:352935-Chlamydomonas_euryale.AAC.2